MSDTDTPEVGSTTPAMDGRTRAAKRHRALVTAFLADAGLAATATEAQPSLRRGQARHQERPHDPPHELRESRMR